VRWANCSRIAGQDCNKDLRLSRCDICLVIQPLGDACDT
jgi:hypothetical protein